LAAKPVLDFAVGLKSPLSRSDILAMRRLGYCFVRARRGKRISFYRGQPRSHYVHVVPWGEREWCQYLALRTFLRAHAGEAVRYGNLKMSLSDLLAVDPAAYARRKRAFLAPLSARAQKWWNRRLRQGKATGISSGNVIMESAVGVVGENGARRHRVCQL
jgi:GrpB-like predicted nucleotidyltransferase (UPF0157 family)